MNKPGTYHMTLYDSELLKSVVSDSDTRHQQISTGQFEGKVKRIILPDIIIDHGHYNVKLIAQGSFSANTVTLMIIHQMDETGKVCGQDLHGGDLLIIPRNGDAEFTIPINTMWSAINVSEDHLAKYGVTIKNSQLFHLDQKTFSQFNKTYLSLEKQVSQGMGDQYVLQDSILSHFLGTIEDQDEKIELRYTDGYLLALNVRDHIIEHIDETLQMHLLCQLTHKSVRTIERTFKKVFNLTVRDYHTFYRLALIRNSLLHDKNISVSNAALKYGYYHLGRFSTKYKRLFNELPSDTLIRR